MYLPQSLVTNILILPIFFSILLMRPKFVIKLLKLLLKLFKMLVKQI